MPVTCHCTLCGATYQVGQEFAGRKIKCPKCAAAIMVTAAVEPKRVAAAPKTAAGAKPLKTAARIEADDPPPLPPPVPSLRRQVAEEPLVPGGVEIPGLSDVPSYASRGRSVPRLPPKRKKSGLGANPGLWIGIGVGACGLIAAVIITLVLVLGSSTKPAVVAVSQPAKATEKPHKGEAPKAPSAPANTLILNWIEAEREGAEIFLDGQPVGVPKTDTVKLTLPVARRTRSASRAKATNRWSSTAVRSRAKTNWTTR